MKDNVKRGKGRLKTVVRRISIPLLIVGTAMQISPARDGIVTVVNAIWFAASISLLVGFGSYHAGWINGHYAGWQKARGYEK